MESIDLKVGDIVLLPLIVAIVEGAKEVGLPTKWARLLTGLLCVGGYALMLLVQAYPEYAQYVTMVLTAGSLFFASTGLYAVGRNMAQAWRDKC